MRMAASLSSAAPFWRYSAGPISGPLSTRDRVRNLSTTPAAPRGAVMAKPSTHYWQPIQECRHLPNRRSSGCAEQKLHLCPSLLLGLFERGGDHICFHAEVHVVQVLIGVMLDNESVKFLQHLIPR